MELFMAPEVLEGLSKARSDALRKSKRLRVSVGGLDYPILRMWDGGFAMSAQDTPHLRGTVEVCDGSRVLHECLIVCSALDGAEVVYEVKRRQRAEDTVPLDFEQADDAPVALLPR